MDNSSITAYLKYKIELENLHHNYKCFTAIFDNKRMMKKYNANKKRRSFYASRSVLFSTFTNLILEI